MNEYISPTWPRTAQYALRLTVAEHAARHVRRIVRSLLKQWQMPELSDAVELGVTELLANVVRHVPDRRCEVLVLRQTAGVRVEVTDGSRRLPATPQQLTPDAENGRGLLLLGALTDKWGADPLPGGGKTVWFECRATEPTSPPEWHSQVVVEL